MQTKNINKKLTFVSPSDKQCSSSTGILWTKMTAVSRSNGKTLMKIITAINIEQIGSAMRSPNWSMRRDEMITPTLPMVSAKTCRNTPGMEIQKYE